ncbi:alanyl-tRNA editing protein [Candidatus Micrarchaeota archaeon]|nr:alanyl-tRNA editing protein [Candidatus Micrarchaeota archaeon]
MKKLFWENPYLREYVSKIAKKDGNRIVPEQTVFFAFSGGQASDSGTIGGIPVKEAVNKNGKIEYLLEKEPEFDEGNEVKIKIDWEKRFRIMRLHSAAHVVYFLFKEKTGIEKLIGSNVDEQKSRIDYEYPESVKGVLPELEEKANAVFSQDNEIKTYPDAENPEKRLWECMAWKSFCGGTHPKSTIEIGKVRLKRKNIGSGKERIEITLES